MTHDQLSRFPRLAELRNLLKNFGNATDITPQIQKTQELMALLPDVDQLVEKELDSLAQCKDLLFAGHTRLMDLKQQVENEYQQILDHVSDCAWFKQHLEIADHQRDKWLCNPNQVQDLLLVWSRTNDAWKYPVTMINAQHDEVIKILISYYLLYMVDTDRDLLIKKYNSIENSVQPRVKFHTVPSWHDLDWATKLGYNEHQMHWGVPMGQMGLVVVWNLFERFNLYAAENFLTQVKPLLRPGGQVFFNMFDADSSNAAAFISDGKIGGMNRAQIDALALKLGMEISMWVNRGSDLISVLLSMPGVLQSDKTKWPIGIVKKS